MKVTYKTRNGAVEVKTGYRKSHHFRAYEEPKDDRRFIEYLLSKGMVDEARFHVDFTAAHYGNSKDQNRRFQADVMNRIPPATPGNHKEVDDYLLSDYTTGMMSNPEMLVIENDWQQKRDLPKSDVVGVVFKNGRWQFTCFAHGEVVERRLFHSKNRCEEFAIDYQTNVFPKICF